MDEAASRSAKRRRENREFTKLASPGDVGSGVAQSYIGGSAGMQKKSKKSYRGP